MMYYKQEDTTRIIGNLIEDTSKQECLFKFLLKKKFSS